MNCLVSEKLNVELDVIKNSVEGLVNLLLESCKHKVRPIDNSAERKSVTTQEHLFDVLVLQLSPDDFRDSVIALGFTEDREAILSKLYSVKKDEISDALEEIGFKLLRYHDMEWRFEVQVMETPYLSFWPSKRSNL